MHSGRPHFGPRPGPGRPSVAGAYGRTRARWPGLLAGWPRGRRAGSRRSSVAGVAAVPGGRGSVQGGVAGGGLGRDGHPSPGLRPCPVAGVPCRAASRAVGRVGTVACRRGPWPCPVARAPRRAAPWAVGRTRRAAANRHPRREPPPTGRSPGRRRPALRGQPRGMGPRPVAVRPRRAALRAAVRPRRTGSRHRGPGPRPAGDGPAARRRGPAGGAHGCPAAQEGHVRERDPLRGTARRAAPRRVRRR